MLYFSCLKHSYSPVTNFVLLCTDNYHDELRLTDWVIAKADS